MPGFVDSLEGDEYFIEVADFRLGVENNLQLSKLPRMEDPNREDSLGSEKHISVDPFCLRRIGEFQDGDVSRKKRINLKQVSAPSYNSFSHQDSVALGNLERLRENHLRRSKSCGEGRTITPPEDFHLLVAKHYHQGHSKIGYEDQVEQKKSYIDETAADPCDEKVKCGALCLFLPGFSKAAKPVRARKEEPPETVRYQEPENQDFVVSKRVSLENFECSSWKSSVVLDDCENQKDVSNLFYDLPLELIRGNVSDTHSLVTTAFVIDKDRKGVLKESSSRTATKKQPDCSRHVRFSTSTIGSFPASPTSCIKVDDPLHKAKEEVNSFIAAQGA